MLMYKWLIWNFRANSILREIDRQIEDLFLRSVTQTEEFRTRLSTLMVQKLLMMMPDYDFRRGFYVQFFAFSCSNEPSGMIELADKLKDLKNAAVEGGDLELEIMFDLLKNFTLLFALKTRSAYALRLRYEIYVTQSRSMNYIVQHFLATKLNDMAGDWVDSKVFYPNPEPA